MKLYVSPGSFSVVADAEVRPRSYARHEVEAVSDARGLLSHSGGGEIVVLNEHGKVKYTVTVPGE